MVLDDLVGRDVNHVILDSQVRTGGIHAQSLLVVHKNNLGGELGEQLLLGSFQASIRAHVHQVHPAGSQLVSRHDLVAALLVELAVDLDRFVLFLGEVFRFVFLHPALLHSLFLCSEEEEEIGRAELIDQALELGELLVGEAVEHELGVGALRRVDNLHNLLLDLLKGDFSFEGLLFGAELGLEGVTDLFEVDDPVAEVVSHHLTERSLSRQGLAIDNAVLHAVA
mmetsp:Transcript_3945/g.5952  ORF Transcript_3945/g.5952 Transcript_3945/m.5952 type:complete len:225 (+) Transcript_3945:795-1469(+)